MSRSAKLTKLETSLLHALQLYTREQDIEVIRMRYMNEADERERERLKKRSER